MTLFIKCNFNVSMILPWTQSDIEFSIISDVYMNTWAFLDIAVHIYRILDFSNVKKECMVKTSELDN